MLKFLFTAYFKDGTVYEQGSDDVSLYNPAKSAFFDVLCLEREENGIRENPLLKFELANAEQSYAVNLVDGSFEINGVPFEMMNRPDISEHIALTNYRIVYFKRVTKVLNMPDLPETKIIHLGWQANDVFGNNFKQIMRIGE